MKPRVGFLGTGWIGRHRMHAMLATDAIEAVAVCDPTPECVHEARELASQIEAVESLDAMLALGLDGVVIATPSAMHADQAIRALDAGAAVFCQKPLGRTASEVRAVVDAARTADRLLGADFSYRHTDAMEHVAALVRSGELGEVVAADLTFHNAYGPDKPWFYDREQSGGGCVIDLGVHLIDLALWALDFPEVTDLSAALRARGVPIGPADVEDYASIRFDAGGVEIRLTCSWRLHAGQEAVIAAEFYGTEGGAAVRNLNGSFYDFAAQHFRGTEPRLLCREGGEWGGRAAAAWARRLAHAPTFDPAAEQFVRSAAVIDRIYGG